MTNSTTIPVTATPAEATDLWAMAYLFNAHWGEQVTVNSGFRTNIVGAISTSEQRWGLLAKPRRVLSVVLQAFNRSEVNRLRSLLIRMAKSRSLFPMYSERASFETALASGNTVLPVNTTNKRFIVGGRVAIVRDTGDPAASSFEIAVILSKTDSSITLTTSTIASYRRASDYVVPLIEGDVMMNVRGTIFTDSKASVQLEVIETAGPTQLDTLVTPGTIPDGEDSYNDLPILSPNENYGESMSFGVMRQGSTSTSGIAAVPTVYGDRAAVTYETSILAQDRAAAFRLIRFFESRAGRLFPFYYISPLTEFTEVSVVGGGSGIVVEADGLEEDWAFRPYIGIVLKDGTSIVRAVDSVSRDEDEDTITFDESATFALEDIERVTTARLCRFDSDGMTEMWVSNHVMQSKLPIIELTNEQDIETENLTPLESADLDVNVLARCGAGVLAAPTYYQAVLCDGTPADVSLENFGQTLPYEFQIVGDYFEVCYRIPEGAPTLAEPVGIIPDAIIQGGCCENPTDPDDLPYECFNKVTTAISDVLDFQPWIDIIATLSSTVAIDVSSSSVDDVVDWLISVCSSFIDPSIEFDENASASAIDDAVFDATSFKAAAGIVGSSGWGLVDIANGIRQLRKQHKSMLTSDDEDYQGYGFSAVDHATAKANAIASFPNGSVSTPIWIATQLYSDFPPDKQAAIRSFRFKPLASFGSYPGNGDLGARLEFFAYTITPDSAILTGGAATTYTFDDQGTGVTGDAWNRLSEQTVPAGSGDAEGDYFGSSSVPANWPSDPAGTDKSIRGFRVSDIRVIVTWNIECVP